VLFAFGGDETRLDAVSIRHTRARTLNATKDLEIGISSGRDKSSRRFRPREATLLRASCARATPREQLGSPLERLGE
jgi:hypothetical protein